MSIITLNTRAIYWFKSCFQDGNSAVVSLNGTQLVMNNQARSRAPLPGFSSFVWACQGHVTSRVWHVSRVLCVTAYHHHLVWTPVKFVKTRVAPRTKSGPGRLLRNQTAAVICDTNRDFNLLRLTRVLHGHWGNGNLMQQPKILLWRNPSWSQNLLFSSKFPGRRHWRVKKLQVVPLLISILYQSKELWIERLCLVSYFAENCQIIGVKFQVLAPATKLPFCSNLFENSLISLFIC